MLIIADDAVAREVYAELFVMRGYDVETAASARAGLIRVAQGRDVTTVVLALANSASVAPLRRRLHAIAPRLKVHVLGLEPPMMFDVNFSARQHLH